MDTFANEVAERIQAHPQFVKDLATLRAHGVMATLPNTIEGSDLPHLEPPDDEAVARLVSAASVFSQTNDDHAKDIAQQIAIFSTLLSTNVPIIDGAVTVLAQLGNFPGLEQVDLYRTDLPSLHAFLRRGLLAEMNRVTIGNTRRALTDFQFDVWARLSANESLAISAPTSAGKSFVVLEYLRQSASRADCFTAIYVAPTRALLAEVHERLEKQLEDLGESVRVTTIPVVDPLQRPRQIYVLTQERLQLLLSSTNLSSQVDLLIVDEAQSIGDDGRGMILQDALEKVQACNGKTRVLFLAPGVSGFEDMGDTIGISDLGVCETALSPVVQNRIVVSFNHGNEATLDLSLLTSMGVEERIGSFHSNRGFAIAQDKRLAAVAIELGKTGRSLIYATGAARAEELARQIWSSRQDSSNEPKGANAREKLAKFIEKDVHKAYSLAKFVRRGVAFHYGNMPSLLREGIEGAFRGGHLAFLCCTTTLFQGVNLPARNVFIDTPTRGNKGDQLDEASLWNFAGRAGRLGRDVVGNVFLVDYHNWEVKPLSERKKFAIRFAFRDALNDSLPEVESVLRGAANLSRPHQKPSERASAAAGLILHRASQGSLTELLNRPGIGLNHEQKSQLQLDANLALKSLDLPTSVLAVNWVIDPLALSSLMTRLRSKISKGDFSGLIPVNPAFDGYAVYNSIFRRMYKHLGGFVLSGPQASGTRGFVNHVTVTALKWMRGEPLSRLVGEAVKWTKKNSSGNTRRTEEQIVDSAIRAMFQLVEQTIRFTLVQWAKAYVDLLKIALIEAGHEDRAKEIYDFSLALELGVATETGRSLVELGLSRISAAAVGGIILDSRMNTQAVKEWLITHERDLRSLVSELVLDELRMKGLLGPVESSQFEA